LERNATSVEGESSIRRNDQYDLNLLQEVAGRRKSTLGDQKTKLDQDDIRRMLEAVKKAGQ
jgi:hypothetical protein